MKTNELTGEISQTFPAVGIDTLQPLREFLRESASSLGASEELVEDIVVAANEAITNIINHGYQGRKGAIEILVACVDGELRIRLRDFAPLFDPSAVPTPDTTLPLERRPPGGMGVHMMREFTDELHYRATPDGCNELTMICSSGNSGTAQSKGDGV